MFHIVGFPLLMSSVTIRSDVCDEEFLVFFDLASSYRLISFTKFNAQLLYSLTICMLHYNPRHVSSINMSIFRRTNRIITASGIVTLCKWLCSMPDESRLQNICSGMSGKGLVFHILFRTDTTGEGYLSIR
jgi:hypothetical protein